MMVSTICLLSKMDPMSDEYDSLEYEEVSIRLRYKNNQEKCLMKHVLRHGMHIIIEQAMTRRLTWDVDFDD